MTLARKIDSNITGLRFAEEETLGVLPTTPDWLPLQPNSYADFGGQPTTIARNPINPSRQRQKGVVTDLDASGGFNTDLTQENLQQMLQGFFFADLRRKAEHEGDIEVQSTDDSYNDTGIGTDTFQVNDLIFASGFDAVANNGLKLVTAVAADKVEVDANLANEGPTAGAKLVGVGHQFAASTVEIVTPPSELPSLDRVSGTFDFTTLGLIPGEWIFIGGDAAVSQFAEEANNGFARVRSVTATRITFDKTSASMVDDDGNGKTIHVYFGRVLKNEVGTGIRRRSFQLERTLGAPDTAQPVQLQAEYLVGSIPNELSVNISQADKVTLDLSFVSIDSEQRTAAQGLKAGNRPTLVSGDAFNTSSDFSRIKLATVVPGDSFPQPLFAFATELTLTVNNNVTPNKAVGVFGAFDATAGTFEVGGNITAYFASVEAVQAVRDNADITLDMHMVKANAGISIDMPLITLGEGRPNVEQDQPITLPLSKQAATGASIDPNLDHTMLMVFYDFLPNLADS